jgi:choline dehydrogenase-like flavoprotein
LVDPDRAEPPTPSPFIGDASVFPAYPEKNPMLTNIAPSWRMGEMLAERFQRNAVG